MVRIKRQNIKENIEKILLGEIKLNTKGSSLFRNNIKRRNLLGEYKCKECEISEWNNKKIILDLDHKEEV